MGSDKKKISGKILICLRNFETIPDNNNTRFSSHFQFHLSKYIRERFDFNRSLFSKSGNIIFSDFSQVKEFCQKINNDPVSGLTVTAGNINAMGLIDEIFHHIFFLYRQQIDQDILEKAYNIISEKTGKSVFEDFIREFITEFPPEEIYSGKLTPEEYLQKLQEDSFSKNSIIEEIILIWIASENPAYNSYRDLFFSKILAKDRIYDNIITELGLLLKTSPGFGPEGQDILSLLMAPSRAVPDSVSGQLKYIRDHWGLILLNFNRKMLLGIDHLAEEEKFRPISPGAPRVRQFFANDSDYPENFSKDSNWMSNLVLMVKSTFVWMDQLSEKYNRAINRIDHIPFEELELLANRGFSGLWLIGLWERSRASKAIKQMSGNPEALSSAYSIYEYKISDDLGGEEAFDVFSKNAEKAGIKIAADMVPNHMGIDSPWVLNNPEWFINTENCPFPSYSFSGQDLSGDINKEIYLEDHYFDKSDAAVVFKWVNKTNGEIKYIYHGNDGTSMPWNDTAQLNYLKEEVRDLVRSKIIEIAGKFSVIRFDAAMTLTQKHFQRLWFPEPGSGGDIPSRTEYGLSGSEFLKLFPKEFWIEVVDSIKRECPDTLLIAEAFWLMEPYFVRTLGMHRVYNSSFMNFLKNEDNREFRASIKNTLVFNPEILKRYVNFMSNPDEDTAILQFGKDDKYFGVCTILATLPGLPLFGHGQIEGFTEKYGMEYKKAYLDEDQDPDLVERHKREIFPLLRMRGLFSNVENFRMYDLFNDSGEIDENVIVYSNFSRDNFSLVIYNNKYAFTSGKIKNSVPFIHKDFRSDEKNVKTESIGEVFRIENRTDRFLTFYDRSAGLSYIRSCTEIIENGLHFSLGAYKYHILMDFRQISDFNDKRLFLLNRFLNGTGCLNLDKVMNKEILSPLKTPFKDIVNLILKEPYPDLKYRKAEFKQLFLKLAAKIQHQSKIETGHKNYSENIINKIDKAAFFQKNLQNEILPSGNKKLIKILRNIAEKDTFNTILPVFIFIREFGEIPIAGDGSLFIHFENWFLWEIIEDIFIYNGVSKDKSGYTARFIKVLCIYGSLFSKLEKENSKIFIEEFFNSGDVKELLGVNNFEGVNWFEGEKMSAFLELNLYFNAFELYTEKEISEKQQSNLNSLFDQYIAFSENAANSGYDYDKLKKFTLESISG